MSYQCDHMAWQQRVQQEFKATNQQVLPYQVTTHHSFVEKQVDQSNYYKYPDLVNYMITRSSHRNEKAKTMANEAPDEYLRKSIPGQKNESYGIGGAMGNRGAFAYTAKSRVSTGSQRSAFGRQSSNNGGAFKRRSVQLSQHSRSSSQIQRFHMAQQACNLNPQTNLHTIYNIPKKKDRFNEGLDDVRSHAKLSNVNAKNLQAFNQKTSQGPKSVFSSHYGSAKGSRVKSAVSARKSILSVSTHTATIEAHKKRIINAVNNLNEEELTKVSEMLKVAEQMEEEQKEKQEQEAEAEQEGSREGSLEREREAELDAVEVTAPASEVQPEAFSSVSRAQGSTYTSQSKINSLQQQLDEERYARIRLEKDLASLQRIQKRMNDKVQNMEK